MAEEKPIDPLPAKPTTEENNVSPSTEQSVAEQCNAFSTPEWQEHDEGRLKDYLLQQAENDEERQAMSRALDNPETFKALKERLQIAAREMVNGVVSQLKAIDANRDQVINSGEWKTAAQNYAALPGMLKTLLEVDCSMRDSLGDMKDITNEYDTALSHTYQELFLNWLPNFTKVLGNAEVCRIYNDPEIPVGVELHDLNTCEVLPPEVRAAVVDAAKKGPPKR